MVTKKNSARITRAMMVREEEAVYRARENGTLLRVREHPRLIDLFCGAGGMTLGFTKLCGHCFRPVFANDNNRYAVETYNANFGNHCVEGDINDILDRGVPPIPEADVVIGGPPCQGFSLLNKKRDGDPRKQLWRQWGDHELRRCAIGRRCHIFRGRLSSAKLLSTISDPEMWFHDKR